MIGNWEDAAFETDGRVTTFRTEHLEITFTGTGIEGGCPAERDNDGCYVCEDGGVTLRPAETITAHKEFCNSSFRWRFGEMEDGGVSIGKTLPAIPTEETSSPLVLYSLILKRTAARTAAVPSGFLMARRQRFPSSFLQTVSTSPSRQTAA